MLRHKDLSRLKKLTWNISSPASATIEPHDDMKVRTFGVRLSEGFRSPRGVTPNCGGLWSARGLRLPAVEGLVLVPVGRGRISWCGTSSALKDESRPFSSLHLTLRADFFLPHGPCCSKASITRAIFEENLHNKLALPAFQDDLRPLLSPGAEFDHAAGGARVMTELIARLPGEPWKGKKGPDL